MIYSDYHMHTTFSHGINDPEDMVVSAIEKGLNEMGFTGHSYTDFDSSYCMTMEGTKNYKKEILRLKEKYSNDINILLGLEKDIFSTDFTNDYDYIIGSVHYVEVGGKIKTIDEFPDNIKMLTQEDFNGDIYSLCEHYYKTVSDVAKITNCDIVGHIDLISKFNEGNKFFDEKNPRYINAYKCAIDKIMEKCSLFEINLGAVIKGYKKRPYPSDSIIDYIISKGGKFILSSDSHCRDNIAFEFEKWQNIMLDEHKGIEIVKRLSSYINCIK